MKIKFVFTILAAVAVSLIGCTTQKEAYKPKDANSHDLENHERLVLMNKRVQDSVTSAGFQEKINPDGRLEVVANIRSRDSRRIQVQVNCVFKDEYGTPTGDETPWQNLILTEYSQEAVHFISMNDKAKRYTIRVREAR